MAYSAELDAAIAAAALVDANDDGRPCPPCVKHAGLCVAHASEVLPQLKQPAWYRDAHSGKWIERETAKAHEKERKAAEQAEKDPQVKKVKRRNARRRGPRNWERSPLDRLDRALAGESTPVRRRVA